MGEQGQKAVEKENVCCILHSEDFILNYVNGEKQNRVDTSKIFKYMTFLKNRFSNQFISLLCSCLKLSNRKRIKMPELLNHPFVTMPSEPKSVKVNLVDLLKISRGWCE
jgi:serine/threonine protein kinase